MMVSQSSIPIPHLSKGGGGGGGGGGGTEALAVELSVEPVAPLQLPPLPPPCEEDSVEEEVGGLWLLVMFNTELGSLQPT